MVCRDTQVMHYSYVYDIVTCMVYMHYSYMYGMDTLEMVCMNTVTCMIQLHVWYGHTSDAHQLRVWYACTPVTCMVCMHTLDEGSGSA